MSKLAVVGAAIIRDGSCLVAKRGPRMSTPDVWEFPGGKVRTGETPRAALIREIAEELGATIEVGAHLGDGVTDRVVLSVYAARVLEGEPHPHEHAELRWVDADGLARLEWAEADIPIWPAVAARLTQGAPA